MSTDFSPQIQAMINDKMATGDYATVDELLRRALETLSDYDQSVADIQAGREDEVAGRVRSVAEVDQNIRENFGFSQ